MRHGLSQFVLTLTLLGAALGCGGALVDGKKQFDAGRYPDAKQTFVAAEQESRTWDDAERARYALYRGLTHAALGDRGQAGVWLREAKAIETAHDGALSATDVERLKLGLEQLGGPLD